MAAREFRTRSRWLRRTTVPMPGVTADHTSQDGRSHGKREGTPGDDRSSSKRPRRGPAAGPLGIKPLGNLLYAPEHAQTRTNGLGRLARLPDELLLSSVFSRLDAEDLLTMAATSRAFYAWSCVEGMWKGHYIEVRNVRRQARAAMAYSFCGVFLVCSGPTDGSQTGAVRGERRSWRMSEAHTRLPTSPRRRSTRTSSSNRLYAPVSMRVGSLPHHPFHPPFGGWMAGTSRHRHCRTNLPS